MNIKNLFMPAAAIIALSMAACTANDDVQTPSASNFPADGVIRVATNVAAPISRAGMTTEQLNSSCFYLNIVNESNSNYSYYAMMKKTDASGIATPDWRSYTPSTTTPYAPILMLWKDSSTPVSVTAVAKEGTSFTAAEFSTDIACNVSANQAERAADVTASDLLYMPVKTIDPGHDLVDGKIQIEMQHRLSKLYVALTLSKEFTPTGTATNPVTAMTVRGTIIAATFNASTDKLKVSTAATADVSPWHDASMYADATATYECILLPQTVEAGTLCIRFYIDGKLYEWFSTAALTLERGKQCTIALTVGRDRVEMGTITSKPWTVSNQGSLGTK